MATIASISVICGLILLIVVFFRSRTEQNSTNIVYQNTTAKLFFIGMILLLSGLGYFWFVLAATT